MPPCRPLSPALRRELLRRARQAATRAYCPYSRFRVGAAVLGGRGIHVGANIENASFGLTLCAERVALSVALAAGDRKLRALAVACIDASPGAGLLERMPCGACRQWMLELAPDAEVLVAGVDETFRLADLLPVPFAIPSRVQEAKDSRGRRLPA